MGISSYIVAMTILQLALQQISGELTPISSRIFNSKISKVLQHNDSIYIADSEQIHILDRDLGLKLNTSTCDAKGCKNVMKVFVNYGDTKLVTCGTGNSGMCQTRNLTDLMVLEERKSSEDLKIVSIDETKPALAFVIGDQIVIAATYGQGFSIDSYYAITTRWLKAPIAEVIFDKNKYLPVKTPNEYLFFFKAILEANGFIFFASNQKQYLETNPQDSFGYVPKIIEICKTDIVHDIRRNIYFSYTDVELNCEMDNERYNLIEDAILVDYHGEQYFIGAFASGEDPEQNSGARVICATSLTKLQQSMETAQKDFSLCKNGLTKDDSRRYLPNNLATCSDTRGAALNCSDLWQQSYYYVIGTETLELTPIYKHPATAGSLSKLFWRTLEPGLVDIHIGTSDGRLIQMNFLGLHEDLEKYHEATVHPGIPIVSIQEGPDNLYVVSEKKVVRYNETNCSEYTTCAETMDGRNPLCGWCILEGRSKRKSASCRGKKWLSSLGQCVSLNLEPAGQRIQAGNDGHVRLNLTNYDIDGSDKSLQYKCEYTGSVNVNISATGSPPKSLKCDIPGSAEPANVTLSVYVMVDGNQVFLTSTEFLYFNCGTYKSCGSCTATLGTSCTWCPEENICMFNTGCSVGSGISVKNECPMLTSVKPKYIPSNQATNLTIQTRNLEKKLDGSYSCEIKNNKGQPSPAEVANDTITCVVNVSGTQKSTPLGVSVVYKKETSSTTLDQEIPIVVNVYSCDILGKDCSHCSQVNSTRYNCKWCRTGCVYSKGDSCNEVTSCGPPTIDRVDPPNGTHQGGTILTIKGTNLGTSKDDIKEIKVAGVKCTEIAVGDSSNGDDYKNKVLKSITCKTGKKKGFTKEVTEIRGNVTLMIHNSSTLEDAFTYKVSKVTDLTPKSGPLKGGTTVSLIGNNLNIGNKKLAFYYNNVGLKNKFSNCYFKPQNNSVILCKTPFISGGSPLWNLKLVMDDASLQENQSFDKNESKEDPWFERKDDPEEITVDQDARGILSGGNDITVQGKNLHNAQVVRLVSTYAGKETEGGCAVNEIGTSAKCKVPPASEELKRDLDEILTQAKKSGRRRRAAECMGCVTANVVIHLDGVTHSFDLFYYQDPKYNKFDGEREVFSTETQRLILTGTNLNLVVDKNGVKVTIGLENCDVVKLTETTLECAAPSIQPKPGILGAEYPEVNVTVGNMKAHLGFLKYDIDSTIEKIGIIAGAAGGGLLALIVIILVIGIMKYKKVGKKAQELNRKLDDMEMEIKSVAKEEFFHMHSTMSGVNKSLVEQGFPYHGYQQYAFNTMFAADYMDNHPLLHEPVVSKGKVSDDTRIKLKRAMETFEGLILNRFFLVSVLSTMEKQKKFFLKEKSNLAGNLCAILLGRMDYLQEVMSALMTNLVEESTGKRTQKTLFRRCESIAEKLLNNWLYLCQYPHVKASFGSPLYLMFKAMQLTIESGPIDVVTEEAKYTLTEERLLRKWNNNSEEGGKDPKLEAKPLTLNVVVDHGQDMFPCKVLDCDTITQVKHKCMTQIYVNYPASQLEIDPGELHLEWHEGFGGSLNLQDEDNTSARDGEWLRINTLAHYSVKDKANMALVDPRAQEEGQENYVNLAQIHTDVDNACNNSMDSTEPLTDKHDEENPQEIKRWHLVKPDTDSGKQQKSLIAELYLNRLFTTKQCVMEYLRPLFDVLLSKDTCPPTTVFLYSFLDDLAEKNKVDQDTVHLWKSHSYIIRVWAKLVQHPHDIFDVDVPPYVDSSMEVLGQVLIDSCSLTPQKHTKDSPPQKLIFMNEVNQYRDKVRDFFQDIQNSTQRPEDLREYLTDINKLQLKDCQFNKMSAMYRFYQQLEPYLDDIIEDLQLSVETSRLELDKKFQQVIGIMEAEDDE